MDGGVVMETVSLIAVKSLEGGGGGGDVTPDGITTEFNASDELQANAVVTVSALPSTDIKPNTLYRVTETVTYAEDGVDKSFSMSKLFRHESGRWVSYTTVSGLTQADYDHLSAAQKVDGTNYIVNGGGHVTRMVYAALDGKPVLNDVTIDGTLTLEDINVYSIDEVDALLEQKVAAEFVDELPTILVANTWYYSKRYDDGTLVADDKRALYTTDSDGVLQYMGVLGDIDLSAYYTKTQTDDNFEPCWVRASSAPNIGDSTEFTRYDGHSGGTTRISSFTAFKFSQVWTWIVGKLSTIVDRGLSVVDGKIGIDNTVTANSTSGLKFLTHNARGLITGSVAKTLGRGISDSSNVIGHSNDAITAKTNTNIVGVKWDGYGHITGKGTEQTISDTYTSSADNQLLSRKGAYNLYNGVYSGSTNMVFCGNVTRTTTQSVNSNTSTAISLTGSDIYRTGLIRGASSGVYISVAGTYYFQVVARLADTGTTTRHWYLGLGVNSMLDDQAGGQWLYTYNRHKAEASLLRYCAAGEVIKPYVYIDSNSGSVQYATVHVWKCNEK